MQFTRLKAQRCPQLIFSDLASTSIFTARKRSCGKVMFLHLSVSLFTGGGCRHSGWTPSWTDPLPSPGLASSGGHRSGRHASYWNAYLECISDVAHAELHADQQASLPVVTRIHIFISKEKKFCRNPIFSATRYLCSIVVFSEIMNSCSLFLTFTAMVSNAAV